MVKAMVEHDCKIELNSAQLRATPARVAVLKFLERADMPADVNEVKDYLDGKRVEVDMATVFRIINKFADKGLVRQVSFNEGKFRYELADRPEHHHLICNYCGDIDDFSDCAIEELEKDISRKKGFEVHNHTLEFYGICRLCKSRVLRTVSEQVGRTALARGAQRI